jgi:methylenetetrahydrofolate dehydrogenase (NADP+) / methenyltetrahydrofolate cyclohydrolase
MSCLIDGKALAAHQKIALKTKARELKNLLGREPSLAVILVGDDPASQIYINRKVALCQELGIQSLSHRLSVSASSGELHGLIAALNLDDAIDGILLQLPLPFPLNKMEAIQWIDPAKDVDGLHPLNQGYLFQGQPRLIPCTPAGCLHLIQSYCDIYPTTPKLSNFNLPSPGVFPSKASPEGGPATRVDPPSKIGPNLESKTSISSDGSGIAGSFVTVVGSSLLVGRPLGMLLMQQGATVTLANSKTRHLEAVTRQADILISATGHPHLITAQHVKKGAIVIDVGIVRVDDQLVGDVKFDEVAPKASFITPVPGGVGPMTLIKLMNNVLIAAKNRFHAKQAFEQA